MHCCQFFTIANVSHKKFIIARNIYLGYIYDIHIYDIRRLDIASEKVCDCTMASACSLDIQLWMVSNRLIAWLWKRDLINRFMYWSNKISDTDNIYIGFSS